MKCGGKQSKLLSLFIIILQLQNTFETPLVTQFRVLQTIHQIFDVFSSLQKICLFAQLNIEFPLKLPANFPLV